MLQIYYHTYDLPILDRVCLAGMPHRLYKITMGKNAEADALSWLDKNLPAISTKEYPGYAADFFHQIEDYLSGKCTRLDYPSCLLVTEFQHRVLQTVARISYGHTATYGRIAAQLSQSDASRAVGLACRANPLPLLIPCHRVVAAQTLGGYSGGIEIKRKLLKLEQQVPVSCQGLLSVQLG